MIPPVFQFVLLCLAAYRLWRLIADDDILQRPRNWLVRLPRDWEDGDPIPEEYRDKLGLFLTCPWCAGAWVSLATYIAWMFTLGETPSSFEDVAVAAGVWFAISATVGFQRHTFDPPEE